MTAIKDILGELRDARRLREAQAVGAFVGLDVPNPCIQCGAETGWEHLDLYVCLHPECLAAFWARVDTGFAEELASWAERGESV